MAADKILDRIDKLIALATNNPNEEEARTAAMQAVKLIREHSCSIALAAHEQPRAPSYPFWNPTPKAPWSQQGQQNAYEDEWLRAQQAWVPPVYRGPL